METIGLFVVIALVGVCVGILSGMLGVGGGTVMVPLFRLVFGLSAVASTATSLFAIIPTSLSGLAGHLRAKTCIPKLGLAMGLAGACTSTLGVQLANVSPSWLIMLVAALIIAYSAFNMFKKAIKMDGKKQGAEKSAAADAGAAGDSAATPHVAGQAASAVATESNAAPVAFAAAEAETVPPRPELSGKQLAIGFVIGLVAGLASGYVGVGGGFIMVPMMLGILNIPMRYASGTSLISIMILAIPSVILQITLGHVDFVAGVAISVGTIPGALIGAALVKKVHERTLRFVFGGMLIVAAIMLVVNELGLLG